MEISKNDLRNALENAMNGQISVSPEPNRNCVYTEFILISHQYQKMLDDMVESMISFLNI